MLLNVLQEVVPGQYWAEENFQVRCISHVISLGVKDTM